MDDEFDYEMNNLLMAQQSLSSSNAKNKIKKTIQQELNTPQMDKIYGYSLTTLPQLVKQKPMNQTNLLLIPNNCNGTITTVGCDSSCGEDSIDSEDDNKNFGVGEQQMDGKESIISLQNRSNTSQSTFSDKDYLLHLTQQRQQRQTSFSRKKTTFSTPSETSRAFFTINIELKDVPEVCWECGRENWCHHEHLFE